LVYVYQVRKKITGNSKFFSRAHRVKRVESITGHPNSRAVYSMSPFSILSLIPSLANSVGLQIVG